MMIKRVVGLKMCGGEETTTSSFIHLLLCGTTPIGAGVIMVFSFVGVRNAFASDNVQNKYQCKIKTHRNFRKAIQVKPSG